MRLYLTPAALTRRRNLRKPCTRCGSPQRDPGTNGWLVAGYAALAAAAAELPSAMMSLGIGTLLRDGYSRAEVEQIAGEMHRAMAAELFAKALH